jgi:hypothetical protein
MGRLLTASPTAHCRGGARDRVLVTVANSYVGGVFFIIEISDAVAGPRTCIAVFAGVGDAVEILARGEIGRQKRRVLVPRRVFEVVLGPRRPVHIGQQ